MVKLITPTELRDRLQTMQDEFGSRVALAAYFDVPPSVMSDVMNHRRDPVKKILHKLSIEKVTLYTPVDTKPRKGK